MQGWCKAVAPERTENFQKNFRLKWLIYAVFWKIDTVQSQKKKLIPEKWSDLKNLTDQCEFIFIINNYDKMIWFSKEMLASYLT